MTADAAPDVPDSLLARLRAEPVRAPEIIALSAAERFGPAAAEFVAGQRKTGPDLAKKVKARHARLARVSGAAGGVGGAFTIVPDLAALVWIQSRMVFTIAAALGYDPRDPMRPAELLVLFDLYDDPASARAALDGTGKLLAHAAATRGLDKKEDDDALATRLVKMGLRRGAKRFAGRLIPGLAILVNAAGNEKATRELADDAIRFYGG
jgi:hypothetical protein